MVNTGAGPLDEKTAPSGFVAKLGFLVWGVRYSDILVVSAYPNFGSVLALPDLTWTSLLRLSAFILVNFFYLAHIFVYNDVCDARINPEEPKLRARHALKRPELSEREVLGIDAALLVASLIGYALISVRLLVLIILIEAITVAYSQPRIKLKGIPVISLSIHFLSGFLYVLGGWVVFREFTVAGFFISSFIGMVLVAGHFFNEIDDFKQDVAVGIRTNAIAFGRIRTFWAGMFGFVGSSGFFVIGSWAWLSSRAYPGLGILLLAAWLVQAWRFRHWKSGDPIKKFRSFYRVVYALFTLAFFFIKLFELLTGP